MLAKCANPACSETFRRLRDGKVFAIEVQTRLSGGAPAGVRVNVSIFWLCKSCCCVMTVILDKARRVQVVLLPAFAKPQRSNRAILFTIFPVD